MASFRQRLDLCKHIISHLRQKREIKKGVDVTAGLWLLPPSLSLALFPLGRWLAGIKKRGGESQGVHWVRLTLWDKPATYDDLTQVVWGRQHFALTAAFIYFLAAWPTFDLNDAGKSPVYPEKRRSGAVHGAAGAGSTGEWGSWAFKGSEVGGDVLLSNQRVRLKSSLASGELQPQCRLACEIWKQCQRKMIGKRVSVVNVSMWMSCLLHLSYLISWFLLNQYNPSSFLPYCCCDYADFPNVGLMKASSCC